MKPKEPQYGRSPALEALDNMQTISALSPEDRAKAAAEFMRQKLNTERTA